VDSKNYLNFKIKDGLYYLLFGKKGLVFDESLLALTSDELDVFLTQLDNLSSNVDVNPSIYNFHRLYTDKGSN
jgi:hypothetical protein